MEKKIIEMAKEYAKETGLSLSEIVENYFKFITLNRKKIKSKQLSPKVKKLRGILNIEEEIENKQIISEELSKKYGL